ncbi:MAG: hypothetical protein ACI92G_002312 [Candidatus Pelagisphaera sp.]|jgi:hypothetical protein
MLEIDKFNRASAFVSRICGFASLALGGWASANTGFVDLNIYPELTEVNTDSVYTVNLFHKLPKRLHYFSLTNFNNADPSKELSDRFTFYTEQNIRWAIREELPLDLTAQLNLRSGTDKERLRLGLRWRISSTSALKAFCDSIHLSYSIDFHLLQLDHENSNVWQMEHVFSMTFPTISERLYLAGFIDHTFGEDLPQGYPSAPIVGEAQLGYRVAGDWHLTTEYRVNGYRRSNTTNLAIGVQYLYKW